LIAKQSKCRPEDAKISISGGMVSYLSAPFCTQIYFLPIIIAMFDPIIKFIISAVYKSFINKPDTPHQTIEKPD